MFWRALIAFGGLTFMVGGCDVLTSGCEEVDFGGTARRATYSCVEGNGDMEAGPAGILMLGGGAAMVTLAGWPFIKMYRDRNRW